MMKIYILNQEYENAALKHECFADYIYAHGKLEKFAKFDLCAFEKENKTRAEVEAEFDYSNDRIENIVAVLPNGEEIPAVLFFWHKHPDLKLEDVEVHSWRKLSKEEELEMKKDQLEWTVEQWRKHPKLYAFGLVVASDDAETLAATKKRFGKTPW